MFWMVMTIVAAVVAVLYGLIGRLGPARGMSAERARTFRRSSGLAVGWVAVCLAHYALGSR